MNIRRDRAKAPQLVEGPKRLLLLKGPTSSQVATEVMRELAAGRAVLGITQASEVNAIPGVTLAGFLPASLQLVSTYQAALTPSGQGKAPAAAFVAFVTGPSGAAAFRAAGFETP